MYREPVPRRSMLHPQQWTEDTCSMLTGSALDADSSTDAQVFKCISGATWFSKCFCGLSVQVLSAEAVSPTSGCKYHVTGQLMRKSRRVLSADWNLGYKTCMRPCSQAPNVGGLWGPVSEDSSSSALVVLAASYAQATMPVDGMVNHVFHQQPMTVLLMSAPRSNWPNGVSGHWTCPQCAKQQCVKRQGFGLTGGLCRRQAVSKAGLLIFPSCKARRLHRLKRYASSSNSNAA